MPWDGSTRRARLPKDWPRRVELVLARDPICEECGVALSTQCDHVEPGDDHRLTNLQGLCDPCHAKKSAREGVAARSARRANRRRPLEAHPGRVANERDVHSGGSDHDNDDATSGSAGGLG